MTRRTSRGRQQANGGFRSGGEGDASAVDGSRGAVLPMVPVEWPPRRSGVRRDARGTRAPDRAWAAKVRSQEDLARCVVMLSSEFTETERVDGQELEVWLRAPGAKRARPKVARQMGTGFVIAHRGRAFLVTARHVARRMGPRARLSLSGGAAGTIALAALVGRRGGAIAWTHHPTADVSIARVIRPPRQLRGRCLPAAMLPAEASAPRGTLELLVVGFPLGLVDPRHLTPIAKRVHAASAMLRFCGDEMTRPGAFFLLDQATMAGCSGAPVFIPPQLQADVALTPVEPCCVGLVSQTIADENGAQFAAVVPSAVIRGMLRRASRRPAARRRARLNE